MTIKINEARLNPVLEKLNQFRFTSPDGHIHYKGFDGIELHAVISSHIELSERLAEVSKNRIITEALFDKKIKGSINTNNFKDALNRTLRSYTNLPISTYYLRTSWSHNLTKCVPSSIKIASCCIKIGLIPKRFSQDSVLENAQRHLHASIPKNYQPVLISINARCPYSALEQGMLAIDSLRGLINLIGNRTGMRITYEKRQPINPLILGPLHTLHENNGNLIEGKTFWYEPRHVGVFYGKLDIRDNGIFKKELLKRLSNIRRGFLIEDAYAVLTRYCRALDHWDWDIAFTDLWQTLEFAVGVTEQKKSHADVVARVAALYADDDKPFVTSFLDHFRQRRNSSIHHAVQHQDAERLIYQLKPIVERLVMMYVINGLRFRNKLEFTDFLDAPSSSEIKARMKLYRTVLRFRK